MLPARQRVIAAAQEDASGGGAAAARVPSLCVSTLPGLRPRPARARRPRPPPPQSFPAPRGPLGRPAPPSGAPTLGQSQTPLPPVSWPARKDPHASLGQFISTSIGAQHMRLSLRSLLLQSPPAELPAVFAFSSRLFGDTSRPPNPFLPVIFVIYLGFFSCKLGLMQQRCLHGRFLFSFFLLHLDRLSLFKTSLIGSVGSCISAYPFYKNVENPTRGNATF